MATATARTSDNEAGFGLLMLQGILNIVIGFLLLTNTGATLTVLVLILGIYWLIIGIVDLVTLFFDRTDWGWKLFTGILGVIAGLVIINHPLWSAALVPTTVALILGIQGLIIGAIAVYRSFKGAGIGSAILGIISILFGLLILNRPLLSAAALVWFLGIIGIVGGVASIILAFQRRK